jgi:hypothetical protein
MGWVLSDVRWPATMQDGCGRSFLAAIASIPFREATPSCLTPSTTTCSPPCGIICRPTRRPFSARRSTTLSTCISTIPSARRSPSGSPGRRWQGNIERWEPIGSRATHEGSRLSASSDAFILTVTMQRRRCPKPVRAHSLKNCRGHRRGIVVFSSRIMNARQSHSQTELLRLSRFGRREMTSTSPFAQR